MFSLLLVLKSVSQPTFCSTCKSIEVYEQYPFKVDHNSGCFDFCIYMASIPYLISEKENNANLVFVKSNVPTLNRFFHCSLDVNITFTW